MGGMKERIPVSASYKIIETLLFSLLCAIAYIPFDNRLRFLLENERAIKLLDKLAGISVKSQRVEDTDLQLNLF